MTTAASTALRHPGTLLRAAYRAIERFFLGQVAIEPLALARILYGLTLFSSYALVSNELESIFGPESISVYVSADRAALFVPQHLWLSHVVLLVSCALFCVGFLTPLAGVMVIVGHLGFHEVSFMHSWGWTRLVHPFVAYLVLANSGARYSVDAFLRRRIWPDAPVVQTVVAWPLRILQCHITALYLTVAWHRIFNVHWHTGSMVYVALSNTVFGRFPLAELHDVKPILAVACWVAWLFELGAPLFLWIPKTRTIFVLGLMTMHLGLELTSTVGFWQLAMLSLLWAFMPPAWARAVLERLFVLRPRVRT
jgi:hypothetical protein